MQNIDVDYLIGVIRETKDKLYDKRVSDFTNGEIAMALKFIDYLEEIKGIEK